MYLSRSDRPHSPCLVGSALGSSEQSTLPEHARRRVVICRRLCILKPAVRAGPSSFRTPSCSGKESSYEQASPMASTVLAKCLTSISSSSQADIMVPSLLKAPFSVTTRRRVRVARWAGNKCLRCCKGACISRRDIPLGKRVNVFAISRKGRRPPTVKVAHTDDHEVRGSNRQLP